MLSHIDLFAQLLIALPSDQSSSTRSLYPLLIVPPFSFVIGEPRSLRRFLFDQDGLTGIDGGDLCERRGIVIFTKPVRNPVLVKLDGGFAIGSFRFHIVPKVSTVCVSLSHRRFSFVFVITLLDPLSVSCCRSTASQSQGRVAWGDAHPECDSESIALGSIEPGLPLRWTSPCILPLRFWSSFSFSSLSPFVRFSLSTVFSISKLISVNKAS